MEKTLHEYFGHALAGATANVLSMTICYPLDTVRSILQGIVLPGLVFIQIPAHYKYCTKNSKKRISSVNSATSIIKMFRSIGSHVRPVISVLGRRTAHGDAFGSKESRRPDHEFHSQKSQDATGMRLEKCINDVTLLGRVGNDPQMRGSDDRPVTIFTLATHINFKQGEGDFQQKTEWHRISVFKPFLRDNVFKYLIKGQRALVRGRIAYGQITDSAGTTHTTTSIVADEVIFFNKPFGHRGENEDGRLYQGLRPVLITVFTSCFVYFYSYQGLKSLWTVWISHDISATGYMSIATTAGAINVLATNPLWVVNTKMRFQDAKVDKQQHYKFTGIIDGILTIIKCEGARGLWRGTFPSLLLVTNPGIQFMAYEIQKRYIQSLFGLNELHSIVYFIMGAIAKLMATFSTYPLQVLQTRLRLHKANTKTNPILGTFRIISQLFKLGGVKSLYQGMEAKLWQTIINTALMFTFYENLVIFVFYMLNQEVVKNVEL